MCIKPAWEEMAILLWMISFMVEEIREISTQTEGRTKFDILKVRVENYPAGPDFIF